jgi:hypothetical protein
MALRAISKPIGKRSAVELFLTVYEELTKNGNLDD